MQKLVLVGFAATLFVATEALHAGAEASPIRIATLSAMPYYTESGSIRRSTDLFDPRLALRNVVIGKDGGRDPLRRERIPAWDIEFGTTATYVEVGMQSSADNSIVVPVALRVELRAKGLESGKIIKTETVAIASIFTSGATRWIVPFFIYGTGCERLEIRVRLLNNSQELGAQTRIIPFSCGE